MDNASSRRTDEHLAAILDETSTWTVNGVDGEVLCMAASLRHALQKVEDCTSAGQIVTGVGRRPHYDVIVLRVQFERLALLVTA